jgi:hypothetical protein
LAGLRIAWKDGEVRPTARPKPKQKRGRRRPDPLAKVTEQLRTWFTAEPWRTGRELLERLQAEYPGSYPTGLLRTLQRRLKIWRSEIAHTMVFGAIHSQHAESQAPGIMMGPPGESSVERVWRPPSSQAVGRRARRPRSLHRPGLAEGMGWGTFE